jgi:uncharacterized protein YgbK (DUF1537 family)
MVVGSTTTATRKQIAAARKYIAVARSTLSIGKGIRNEFVKQK